MSTKEITDINKSYTASYFALYMSQEWGVQVGYKPTPILFANTNKTISDWQRNVERDSTLCKFTTSIIPSCPVISPIQTIEVTDKTVCVNCVPPAPPIPPTPAGPTYKIIKVISDSLSLTDIFFSTNVISEITTLGQSYLVGVDFTQAGNTITWINGMTFSAGQVLKAEI